MENKLHIDVWGITAKADGTLAVLALSAVVILFLLMMIRKPRDRVILAFARDWLKRGGLIALAAYRKRTLHDNRGMKDDLTPNPMSKA